MSGHPRAPLVSTSASGTGPAAPVTAEAPPAQTGIIEVVTPQLPQRFAAEIEYDEPTAGVRVGVVVPFDFGLDWDYWQYLPEGVSLYFTRTPHLQRSVGTTLARRVGRPSIVTRATRTLQALDPTVVIYACSSGSFVEGLEGEAALRAAMLAGGARRAVTASGAMLDALRAASVSRVAVATPYRLPLTQRLVAFLEAAGFEVPSSRFLGISRGIDQVSRRTIAELVEAADHPRADAVFVSCTALRAYGIIADLEAQIGKPVFTANQVSLWAAIAAAAPAMLAPEHPGWTIGGASPMARSTALLLDAAAGWADDATA